MHHSLQLCYFLHFARTDIVMLPSCIRHPSDMAFVQAAHPDNLPANLYSYCIANGAGIQEHFRVLGKFVWL